jgi:hypothetical protein
LPHGRIEPGRHVRRGFDREHSLPRFGGIHSLYRTIDP